MTVAQKFAGIPIDLPGWTQVVAYAFLLLLAGLIGVLVWKGIQARKVAVQEGEIHAKVNLILLMLRNWQEHGELTDDPEPLPNEHYAPDPGHRVFFASGGSHRIGDNETTDQHERIR